MDVISHFFVTICVVLQVTWSASGLKLPLCNMTSKSVPYKAPPNSPIIENSIPFQIGLPCPKCARISSTNVPHLQPEEKKPEDILSAHHTRIIYPSNPNADDVTQTSPNKILSSSKVLKKTSETEASINPTLSELVLSQNMLKNSPTNLKIPPSNTPLVSSNNVVNPVSGIDTLFSSKNENASFQNGYTNTRNANTEFRNTLNLPLRQIDRAIGNVITSQNSPTNTRSSNTGEGLNLHSPYDRPYVVDTGITQFTSPQNIDVNNSSITSLNSINPRNFDFLFSKYNEASPKSSDFNIKLNSNQNGPLINNQVNFSDKVYKLPIASVMTSQDTSLSLNKEMNNDLYSKLSSMQADARHSKLPLANIPFDSKVSSPNTVSTSAHVTTVGNFKNHSTSRDSNLFFSTKSESFPLFPSAPHLYNIPNQNPHGIVPKLLDVNNPVDKKMNSSGMSKILKPKNNIITDIAVVTPNSQNTFIQEKTEQNSIISNSAVDPLSIKKESNFLNVISNNLLQQYPNTFTKNNEANADLQTKSMKTSTISRHENILGNNLAQTTTLGKNLQLKSSSTPNVSVSLQPNLSPISPNKYFPSHEKDAANIKTVSNNFRSNDFNNIDLELQAAILNQLQNPVVITNNEKDLRRTSSADFNDYNIKPIQPLAFSNNFQINDFPNFISPLFAENEINSFETNSFKTALSQSSPLNLFTDEKNVALKMPLEFYTIPSIGTNDTEIEQKFKSFRTEFNPQNRLRASSLNTNPLRNNSEVSSKLSVPFSVNAIPKVTPVSSNNIAQSSVNNFVKPSIPHSLLSPTRSLNAIADNNLQSDILLKPANSISADSTLINKNLKSKIDSTESIKQDLIPTNELYSPFINSKLYKPLAVIKNNSENNVPRVSISSKTIFTPNENINYDIDEVNAFKGNSHSTATSNGNIPTPGYKAPNNPSNNVAYKQSNLVSTSPNLEVSAPIQNIMNVIPIFNSNSVLPLNNILLPITGSTMSSIVDLHPDKNIIAQNLFNVNTDTVNKMSIENTFAQNMQNSNSKCGFAENVVETDISKSQSIPYIIPLITNLPNVYAPKYAQPQTVINYSNVLPSVPQIGDLISTSKLTSSLNDLAAEVIRRYFTLVGQKLNSKPTVSSFLNSIPTTNSDARNIESMPLFQSNTQSALPISSLNNLSPILFTTSNLVTSPVISSAPNSSINLTGGVSLNSRTSLPELPQPSISLKENEKLTSSSLVPYLSSLATIIPEESPPNIVNPTYLPTVDYQFLPSPVYPVVPSYSFPLVFPAVLPSIIEAPVLRTGCKESQDFKKILEILVLNELINNNKECKDWGTLQTIIALLCAT